MLQYIISDTMCMINFVLPLNQIFAEHDRGSNLLSRVKALVI